MDMLPPTIAEQEKAAYREPSMEQVFQGEPVPSRAETITTRSVAVSFVLGVTMSAVGMKLSLAAGFLPSLSIPAVLLGFFLPPVWVRVKDFFEAAHVPFTRQENTFIQTFVVACSSIAYSGGFGSYILAMTKNDAVNGAVNSGSNVEEPRFGQLVMFLFLTCFAGIFAIVPFRNSLVIRQHLTFPSGSAAAQLINSIHTPEGVKQASMKVSVLFRTFCGTIWWSLFQWSFASGPNCGFETFPTFGLTAFRLGFYFDFSMGSIGAGMLCSYKTTISMLVGSLVSWGIMWPYIETKKGSWYPEGLSSHNLNGIHAYRVFIGLSMVLADGIFHLLRALYVMYNQQHTQEKRQQITLPFQCLDNSATTRCFDDWRREQVFLRDRVSNPAAVFGYVALSVVSIIVMPQLYPQLRYQHVAFAYLILPVLAFCNTYGAGIADMNIATTYAKISMLVIGSWVGLDHGGVVASLAVGGIIMSSISTAADLMQDFRTGYLTLTSPHTVLISHVTGTVLGCVINPVIFCIYYHVFNGGNIVPYAKMFRSVAMTSISQQGLPKYSVLLCMVFFILALAVSVLLEVSTQKRWRARWYIPSTTAMAIAFFVPPTMAIGMFIGSMAMYLWWRLNGDGAQRLSPMVAAGLICGDGFGSLMTSTLVLFKVGAPICVTFVPRDMNKRLDAFLATIPPS
ncbi:hypothetical protein ACP70R_021975 [Stipagrostis hirtigluma subsp. patula]